MGLNNVAVEQFRDQFSNVYQITERRLNGTTIEMRGIVGNSYQFSVSGKFTLHDRGAFHTNISPTEVTYTPKTVTFVNKIAKIPTDIFEQAEVNASERQNLARISAYALTRMEDQVIINALGDSSGVTIPDGGTNLTVAKLIEAKRTLDINNVPSKGRHLAIHSYQLASLLNEDKITNYDYNTIRALVRGEIDTFLGFTFHEFGDMDEGGLPKTGDIREVYMWQMESVGTAYRINPTITVDWEPAMQSYIVIPKVSLGSTAILDEGIVKIECDETA